MNQARKETLWIILTVWILIAGFSLLFPGGGNAGPAGLSFYSFTELWTPAKNTPEDAARTDSLIQSYSARAANPETIQRDTLTGLPVIDLTRQGFLNEEIPQALIPFFQALKEVANTQQIKIVHYGDSQIEGDRISASLRKLFQSDFGGKGTGFIPLSDPASVWAYERNTSANWKRHTVFQNKHPEKIYGISGTSFRFARTEIKDSIAPDSISVRVVDGNKANLNFKLNYVNGFDVAKLSFAPLQNPCLMTIKSGDSVLGKIQLSGTEVWNETILPLTSAHTRFSLQFEADKSPTFYGLSLEGNTGVQVDNYAIRGHTGDGLNQIPLPLIADQFRKQNIKLVILQYGNNAIPFLDSVGECKQFEEIYYRLYSRFRQQVPEAAVLIIGVGDMITRIQGNEVTWPLLKEFRNAQKRAAERSGCAFWDLFEAMGGERSLLAWHEKKLASKDGHLSPSGQQLIAGKLYEDILAAYLRYQKTQ